MADTWQNLDLGPARDESGILYISRGQVTTDGTTVWRTGLKKVLFAGGNKVSGTGISADGIAISDGIVTITSTNADVLDMYAVGYL